MNLWMKISHGGYIVLECRESGLKARGFAKFLKVLKFLITNLKSYWSYALISNLKLGLLWLRN